MSEYTLRTEVTGSARSCLFTLGVLACMALIIGLAVHFEQQRWQIISLGSIGYLLVYITWIMWE